MNDTVQSTPIPPVADPVSAPAETPARATTGYVLVAIAALAVGAGGMFIALKTPSAASGSPPLQRTATVASDAAPPAGGDNGTVYVSPARQQLIGVKTTAVTARDLTQTIRAVGTLVYDETRVTQVHTRVSGWIDQLFVDYVGKAVQKGQPLFTIYSPELVATQQEYLLARRAQQRLSASQFEETRQSAGSLLAAASTRLALWDVNPAQIAELDRTGEPQKTVTLYAPFGGVVLERNAYSGQYITPEVSAFKLADVSTLWAVGEIFESDVPSVRVGQAVTIDLTNSPGARPMTGRVEFIAPDVDPNTRRVRVRAEIPNPTSSLKPDTFVTLTFQSRARQTLAVPAEAVIDTGLKQYVILARGQGYFEPRPVRLGAAVQDFYPVLSGLAKGDQVVTSSQFLLDSETNLQAALQAMADPTPPPSATTSNAFTAEHQGQTGGAANSPAAGAATFDIAVRTQPDPPRVGDNGLEVLVKDSQGQLITGASVDVSFFMAGMPSMGMPAMRTKATLPQAEPGVFRGTGQIPTAGRWEVTVGVDQDGRRVATKRLALVVR